MRAAAGQRPAVGSGGWLERSFKRSDARRSRASRRSRLALRRDRLAARRFLAHRGPSCGELAFSIAAIVDAVVTSAIVSGVNARITNAQSRFSRRERYVPDRGRRRHPVRTTTRPVSRRDGAWNGTTKSAHFLRPFPIPDGAALTFHVSGG